MPYQFDHLLLLNLLLRHACCRSSTEATCHWCRHAEYDDAPDAGVVFVGSAADTKFLDLDQKLTDNSGDSGASKLTKLGVDLHL